MRNRETSYFLNYRGISQVVNGAVEEGVMPLLHHDVRLAPAKVGLVVDVLLDGGAHGVERDLGTRRRLLLLLKRHGQRALA